MRILRAPWKLVKLDDSAEWNTMRNSNFLVAITVSVIGMVLLSCARMDRGSARVSFVTKYAPIEFSFPPGWHTNRDDHPYDLQCFSSSKDMNTGVFVFKRIDLAADSEPIDTFWKQVNDLKSKRASFEELEALHTLNYDDKTVTSITYLGDKDSSRYCYQFSLIEFKADNSKFAVVLQVARPGGWEKSKPILGEIVRSARTLPDDR